MAWGSTNNYLGPLRWEGAESCDERMPGISSEKRWVICDQICTRAITTDLYPANKIRWTDVGLMLGRRRRRRANSKPTLGQRIVFALHPRDSPELGCGFNGHPLKTGVCQHRAMYLVKLFVNLMPMTDASIPIIENRGYNVVFFNVIFFSF